MSADHDTLIQVHDEWKGWRTAEVRVDDLESVHWFQPGEAPHPLVHGYILCTRIVTGAIPHRCEGQGSPHRLLVCVLKRHTLPTVFEELARRADAHPGPFFGHTKSELTRSDVRANIRA